MGLLCGIWLRRKN
ncbi:MAG: hypothetical protein DCF12_17415 [Snowella sp.]|nr:MAG: hypothetical protein DCF12_17415 [Snowella sp.]